MADNPNAKQQLTGQLLADETAAAEEALYHASQWDLIRMRFAKHKLAIVSLVVLGVFYVAAIFADFVAPYDPRAFNVEFTKAPPQRVRIFRDGRLHRPFVYPLIKSKHPQTFSIIFTEDLENPLAIRLIVHGDQYKMWGLIDGDRHLFGIDESRLTLFGADNSGRDVLSRVIYGARLSLTIGLVGVFISLILGIGIGGLSGYYGGAVDMIIQRIIEVLQAIPSLPLWMALSVALPDHWSIPQRFFAITVVLSIVGWTGLARVVRGKFIALREEDFVRAAEINGSGRWRLIFSHMLPSFYSHIIASTTLSIPGMILGETTLSFLGLGLQPPAISWGVLLNEAQSIRALAQSPWFLIPGLLVVVAVLAFNFLGDGLRDAADPYGGR